MDDDERGIEELLQVALGFLSADDVQYDHQTPLGRLYQKVLKFHFPLFDEKNLIRNI